ncbi:Elongation factor 4 [Limihaloglobus sulfuriphilus]|uniref:Elongation factor 4 n=1 Tax=Limihaloglobus sulfuriphilus TaxID=1851148 RepID=A0A1Q2MEW0_9BACT|nr:translation elongation factor 4 [Limihaloglobus sulfuriphilus]AQQ70782.1 Elongation factor 4 [Limihaloglobus sulfuriphilus]
MGTEHIRNFSIVAHIDHGKSTIADRLLLMTGSVTEREFHQQLLDSMDLERERGITIKASAVTMDYVHEGQKYMINFIDTPGHVDFHYEVSRALAACEGALLVVDSSQGVEAQTVANAYLAVEAGLEIIPVLNKVDLPAAQPEVAAEEVETILGFSHDECYMVSAKSGLGMKELLTAIVEKLPAPLDRSNEALRALIFDSHFDGYRGVICYVRVVSGELKTGQKIMLMGSNRNYNVTELGKFKPQMVAVDSLGTGEVGYLIANIKSLADVTVGDTITDDANPADTPLPGYNPPMQMVFSDFYPADTGDYPKMKAAFEKLALNDSSFSFTPQNSPALGFGFRCGFLGLLHMEIIQERLERENDIGVVQTAPTVSYEILTTSGEVMRIDSPSQMPDPSLVAEFREPIVRLEIIMPKESIGAVMQLTEQRRCKLNKTEYISPIRVMMEFRAPLAEIVYDFYDVLKGATHGYATMDYELLGFEKSNLVKIDILVNKVAVDALSIIVHRSNAEARGRRLLIRLRRAINRHQFEIPLQVAIGGKIIARETIKAFRKDVTSKLYGGDITRKMKVLKKQKEGKKRMKSVGSVQIPQEAFMTVLKNED